MKKGMEFCSKPTFHFRFACIICQLLFCCYRSIVTEAPRDLIWSNSNLHLAEDLDSDDDSSNNSDEQSPAQQPYGSPNKKAQTLLKKGNNWSEEIDATGM